VPDRDRLRFRESGHRRGRELPADGRRQADRAACLACARGGFFDQDEVRMLEEVTAKHRLRLELIDKQDQVTTSRSTTR